MDLNDDSTQQHPRDGLRLVIASSHYQSPHLATIVDREKGEKAPKQPYAIVPIDGEQITFAGLWEAWCDPATDEWVRTFTIVTTYPNETLATIHNRMPAILPEEHHAKWLCEGPAEPDELLAMLRPRPSNSLWAFPIKKKVARDDATLLEPPAVVE